MCIILTAKRHENGTLKRYKKYKEMKYDQFRTS